MCIKVYVQIIYSAPGLPDKKTNNWQTGRLFTWTLITAYEDRVLEAEIIE